MAGGGRGFDLALSREQFERRLRETRDQLGVHGFTEELDAMLEGYAGQGSPLEPPRRRSTSTASSGREGRGGGGSGARERTSPVSLRKLIKSVNARHRSHSQRSEPPPERPARRGRHDRPPLRAPQARSGSAPSREAQRQREPPGRRTPSHSAPHDRLSRREGARKGPPQEAGPVSWERSLRGGGRGGGGRKHVKPGGARTRTPSAGGREEVHDGAPPSARAMLRQQQQQQQQRQLAFDDLEVLPSTSTHASLPPRRTSYSPAPRHASVSAASSARAGPTRGGRGTPSHLKSLRAFRRSMSVGDAAPTPHSPAEEEGSPCDDGWREADDDMYMEAREESIPRRGAVPAQSPPQHAWGHAREPAAAAPQPAYYTRPPSPAAQQHHPQHQHRPQHQPQYQQHHQQQQQHHQQHLHQHHQEQQPHHQQHLHQHHQQQQQHQPQYQQHHQQPPHEQPLHKVYSMPSGPPQHDGPQHSDHPHHSASRSPLREAGLSEPISPQKCQARSASGPAEPCGTPAAIPYSHPTYPAVPWPYYGGALPPASAPHGVPPAAPAWAPSRERAGSSSQQSHAAPQRPRAHPPSVPSMPSTVLGVQHVYPTAPLAGASERNDGEGDGAAPLPLRAVPSTSRSALAPVAPRSVNVPPAAPGKAADGGEALRESNLQKMIDRINVLKTYLPKQPKSPALAPLPAQAPAAGPLFRADFGL